MGACEMLVLAHQHVHKLPTIITHRYHTHTCTHTHACTYARTHTHMKTRPLGSKEKKLLISPYNSIQLEDSCRLKSFLDKKLQHKNTFKEISDESIQIKKLYGTGTGHHF